MEGDSNKCIARKINSAEGTVKVHVKAILRKIRVQNRTQAAIWAMSNDAMTRLANDSSPPSTLDMRIALASARELVDNVKSVSDKP